MSAHPKDDHEVVAALDMGSLSAYHAQAKEVRDEVAEAEAIMAEKPTTLCIAPARPSTAAPCSGQAIQLDRATVRHSRVSHESDFVIVFASD